MSVVIPESCKDWKIAMSCPEIPGITDDPAAVKAMQQILHVIGDAIAWLSKMPAVGLRHHILNAYLTIMSQAQHEMNGAIDEMVEIFIWQTDLEQEEELFGIPLRSSLMGCLEDEDEMRIVSRVYPNPEEINEEEHLEEEDEDGHSDIL
jgi:hypothetical protein